MGLANTVIIFCNFDTIADLSPQVTLARVICDNSDNIKHVQKDVFGIVQSHAEYLPCEQLPSLDLSFWKECCNEQGKISILVFCLSLE